MAELSVQEWLLPSLLDRLEGGTGQQDGLQVGSGLSLRQWRDSIERDLASLLNTSNLGETLDAAAFPGVARSVVNYGMPPLAGIAGVGVDIDELETQMHEAIRAFEPRILAHTLRVTLLQGDRHDSRALVFDIEGELWAQPVPLRLLLRTEVDLEVGAVKILDRTGYR